MTELFREFGLPTVTEAIENGVVSRLQRSWIHPAVFIARDKTKGVMGWDAFNRGAPNERGGAVADAMANGRVTRRFKHEYEKLCQLVRRGEVLTCRAAIAPFVPRPCMPKVVEKTGFNKPVSFDQASENLKRLRAGLSGK